jgi:hypothetical protein
MAKKKSKHSWNPKSNVSRERLEQLALKSRLMNPDDPLYNNLNI